MTRIVLDESVMVKLGGGSVITERNRRKVMQRKNEVKRGGIREGSEKGKIYCYSESLH